MHGYGHGSISPGPTASSSARVYECAAPDSLVGSRMLVGNVEVRAPLVGLFRGDSAVRPGPD